VLFALSNPCVTRGSSFVEDFLFVWDSVFEDDCIARMGSLRCRIQALPVEGVSLMICESPATQFSLMISESAATQFSVMISKPTWVVCAVESMRHQWKQF
jgi:hypothetical protein